MLLVLQEVQHQKAFTKLWNLRRVAEIFFAQKVLRESLLPQGGAMPHLCMARAYMSLAGPMAHATTLDGETLGK